MQKRITEIRANGDSIGGVIECYITGLTAGLGEPMFGGVESKIAQIVYGIPAVKAVDFGAGFDACGMPGSQHNDAFTIENNTVRTITNNAGGILGGISSGMPIIFRVGIKPTPSIAKLQQSISLSSMEERDLTVEGRHDPCIVPRAVPVVEAAAAIAIFDALLSNY
jgi:chorismate synthase